LGSLANHSRNNRKLSLSGAVTGVYYLQAFRVARIKLLIMQIEPSC
jgi:hypothetical protein